MSSKIVDRSKWSEEKKHEAVQSYLLLGNLALVARMMNIPEVTLRHWKAQPWWKELTHEFQSQERVQLSAKLKKIVEASLSVVEDRLLNGDYQFDQKSGEVVRKPVNMRDAHRVAVDLSDRQQILERSEVQVLAEDAVEDKLLRLAQKFAELATKKIDEQRTIDVEDIKETSNALHEERQA
jgi:transposase-like protein